MDSKPRKQQHREEGSSCSHVASSKGSSGGRGRGSPMRPTRQILPKVGPSPPAISTLYLSIAFLHTAAQSTPSGTCARRTGHGQQLSLEERKEGGARCALACLPATS